MSRMLMNQYMSRKDIYFFYYYDSQEKLDQLSLISCAAFALMSVCFSTAN
jgi:hypothetical protein